MAGLRPKVQIEKSMDKKTICIFTIHAYNYGAVLQACALRLFCEKTIRDSDVRIVGFYRECHSRDLSPAVGTPVNQSGIECPQCFQVWRLETQAPAGVAVYPKIWQIVGALRFSRGFTEKSAAGRLLYYRK